MTGKREHGESHTRLHNIWLGIKNRCSNPKSDRYQFYGAKGIEVCEEWRNDYISFRDWAKSNGYSNELTIDRIDVYGNYEPSNCRWVDRKHQARNRTTNVFYKGKCLAQWCEELKIDPRTLDRRIHQYKWSIEKALFTPVRKQKQF